MRIGVIGVIGGGAIARRHVEPLRDQVTEVCDIDEARAGELAASVGPLRRRAGRRRSRRPSSTRYSPAPRPRCTPIRPWRASNATSPCASRSRSRARSRMAGGYIDLQCALAGPIVSVQAASASGGLALAGAPGTGLDDAVALTLHFASEALGSVLVGWTDAQDPPIYSLDVLTADVALQLELDPVFRLAGRARGESIAVAGRRDPRESTLDRFLAAVRSEQAIASGGTAFL